MLMDNMHVVKVITLTVEKKPQSFHTLVQYPYELGLS